MGIEQVFANSLNLSVTLIALAIYYISTLFATKGGVVNRGMIYCFWGFAFYFASAFFATIVPPYSENVDKYVFVELSLLVISFCFFIACSTQLLLGKRLGVYAVLLILAIGSVPNVFFLFVDVDAVMIDKIRLILPLGGFLSMAVAFSSKSSRKSSSYLFGAVLAIFLVVLYALDIVGLYEPNHWWFDALVYLFMSMLLFVMKSTELELKVIDVENKALKKDEKLKEIIWHSPFPIIISRLSDDRLLVVNNNAIRLFGIFEDELDRYKLKDFFAEQTSRKELAEKLENGAVVTDFEFLADPQRTFSPFWLLTSASVIEYDAEPAIYMAFQDITSIKNKEAVLENQAVKDPLTAIYNRRYFETEVKKRIEKNIKKEIKFSVLMLDADHFKNVNDTYGHKTGDKVLIELASLCDKALRESDIVARFGGEEFVMFLDNTDEKNAVLVANRLRESIQKLDIKAENGEVFNFTVSVGVCSSDYATKLNEMVNKADLALYKAKESGRNRVESYNIECEEISAKKADKKESVHPVYDIEKLEEISLIDESNKK